MADKDLTRRFAGVDPDEGNQLIYDCHNAAVEWYTAAGVPPGTKHHLYNFWVSNLAAWFYDHRGGNDPIPDSILGSVHQMRPKKGASA